MLKLSFFVVVTAWLTSAVQAREHFLDTWRDKYPESQSGDINCQLCHQSILGGNPWNAYGWDIHLEYNQNGFDLVAAFEAVEMLNSDADDEGINNIDEINTNTQPGWLLGAVNTAYNCIGDACEISFTENNFHPPTTVDPHRDKLALVTYPIEFEPLTQEFYKPIIGTTSGLTAHNNYLFVADQLGIIWRVNLTSGVKEIYIDIRESIFQPISVDDQRGLIGFTFHPNFADNGLIYITSSRANSGLVVSNFSSLKLGDVADHQMVISELTISNPKAVEGLALVELTRNILVIDQPQENNNGGELIFGRDGFLYISIGDGGGSDDEGVGHGSSGNGQNASNPYAAILRIDPHGTNFNNGRYGIPLDNPFINDAEILNEIYAYGFRNPSHMSFNEHNELFVADRGENHVEEINRVESGGNYGWNLRQGPFYFLPNMQWNGLITITIPDDYPLNPEKIDPLFSYDQDEGQAVVGGYQYTGSKYVNWRGKYVFADENGRVLVGDPRLEVVHAHSEEIELSLYGIASDQSGNFYLLGRGDGELNEALGEVLKIESTIEFDDGMCFPVMAENQKIVSICL